MSLSSWLSYNHGVCKEPSGESCVSPLEEVEYCDWKKKKSGEKGALKLQLLKGGGLHFLRLQLKGLNIWGSES